MESMRVSVVIWFAVVAFTIQGFVPSASAQSTLCLNCDGAADTDVLFFGGVMTDGDFPGWSNIPLAASIEDSFFLGAAVNRQFIDLGMGFHIGGEIGLAGRFGDGTSAELWGGPSLRYEGFRIGAGDNLLWFSGGLECRDRPNRYRAHS